MIFCSTTGWVVPMQDVIVLQKSHDTDDYILLCKGNITLPCVSFGIVDENDTALEDIRKISDSFTWKNARVKFMKWKMSSADDRIPK